MSDANTLMALKNAWTGALAASERVRDLAPAIEALPETTDLASLDLEAFHSAVLAQSIGVMALRGLLEELRRRAAASA